MASFTLPPGTCVGAQEKSQGEPINVGGTRNVLLMMQELGIPKGVSTNTLTVFSDREKLKSERLLHMTHNLFMTISFLLIDMKKERNSMKKEMTPDTNLKDAPFPTRRTTTPTPRWVKVSLVIILVLVLLFVILHLTGNGMGHMHMSFIENGGYML